MRRVVWASSETVLGLPFDRPPDFAPIDETVTPRPETSYALSKLVGETMAVQFARRTGPDRRAADLEHHGAARLRAVPVLLGRRDDPEVEPVGLRRRRDVAQAARRGLEAEFDGAEICIVAAADTCMTRPSADLMAEVFPTVPLKRPVEGRDTLLAIEHARRLLGYEPEHRWSDHVAFPSEAPGTFNRSGRRHRARPRGASSPAVHDPQLVQHRRHVVLHGPVGDHQALGDARRR